MSHDVIWLSFLDFNSISANIDRQVPHKDIIVQLFDSIIQFISQKRFPSVNDSEDSEIELVPITF